MTKADGQKLVVIGNTDIESLSKDSGGWGEILAKCKTHTLTIDNTQKETMEYYYRRGNKYFLRNTENKLSFEAPIDFEFKRGMYDVTFTLEV